MRSTHENLHGEKPKHGTSWVIVLKAGGFEPELCSAGPWDLSKQLLVVVQYAHGEHIQPTATAADSSPVRSLWAVRLDTILDVGESFYLT